MPRQVIQLDYARGGMNAPPPLNRRLLRRSALQEVTFVHPAPGVVRRLGTIIAAPLVLVVLAGLSLTYLPQVWRVHPSMAWPIFVAVPLGLSAAALYLLEWINHARLPTSISAEPGRLTWRGPGFRGMRARSWSAQQVMAIEVRDLGRVVGNLRIRVGCLEVRIHRRPALRVFSACEIGELIEAADELKRVLWGAG